MGGTTAIGGVRPSSDLSSGKRAGGRYVLGDLLGRGGMAEVFAGHSMGDHGFQKPVAIKRLLPELANDHVFVERLISEAKLLVGMQHGNIVSVLDLARDGDDVFLVMEFVDGPSLRQLLKSRGQRGLSVGVATYIAQAAAAGLEFAHARPGGAVIHADISPSNLLLTTSGEVRVADFGIARREGGGHGVVEGKWAYMAPEQARGEPLTPRSDVFALGVVLYELICGAHPFGRQVTAEERDSEPMRVIPPRVVKPSIPHGIDAICMRALSHDPRDRYARMQQLIDALGDERFSNGWREGASELAQSIRECTPGNTGLHQQPRTMITDRPVTIVTRSLLRELTPAAARRRASSPRLTGAPSGTPAPTPIPVIADSGARTSAILAQDIMRAAAQIDLPAMLRADGTPLPPFRLSEAVLPGQDLASVIGGHTVTGSHHVAVQSIEGRSTTRWTFGVLAVAAVIGVIAAAAIQLAPSGNRGVADPTEIPPTITEVAGGAGGAGPSKLEQDLGKVAPSVVPGTSPSANATDTTNLTSVSGTPIATANLPTANSATSDPASATVNPTNANPPISTPPVSTPPISTPPVSTPPVSIPRDNGARTTPARKKEPGILRVQSEPWAWAMVAGQRHDTPTKFTLPPGRYTVRFQAETGKTLSKTVTIESGKVSTLTVNLEDDN